MSRRPHVLQVLVCAVAALWLLPFAWMVCASFKAPADFFSSTFLPWGDLGRLTLDNYRALLGNFPFFGWLLSPIIAAAAMALSSVSVIANALRLRTVRVDEDSLRSEK